MGDFSLGDSGHLNKVENLNWGGGSVGTPQEREEREAAGHIPGAGHFPNPPPQAGKSDEAGRDPALRGLQAPKVRAGPKLSRRGQCRPLARGCGGRGCGAAAEFWGFSGRKLGDT